MGTVNLGAIRIINAAMEEATWMPRRGQLMQDLATNIAATSGCPFKGIEMGWMVRGTVVSRTHQGSSPGARIYSWIYFRISGDAHSVAGDVPVDDEVPTVAS